MDGELVDLDGEEQEYYIRFGNGRLVEWGELAPCDSGRPFCVRDMSEGVTFLGVLLSNYSDAGLPDPGQGW